MTLLANTIKSPKGSRHKSKRLGRGNATQKGTTAGRGMKGQRARSGGKSRTAVRGLRPSILKVPKLRGFKSQYAKKETVTLSTLNRITNDGDTVTPEYLNEKGAIDKPQNGVKIVARGELKKKLKFENCLASKGALEAIEKAGGSLVF